MLLKIRTKIFPYLLLMRWDRPIGFWLLLWPTWWALWVANQGPPPLKLLVIFSLGVFLMRSAGCVINDFADRDFDGGVARTQDRPLASGVVKPTEAIILFLGLGVVAGILTYFLNEQTRVLAVVAFFLATLYPFTKRYTYWPQLVLGLAFAMSVLMAFTATHGQMPPRIAWLMYLGVVVWTLMYDTVYAVVDRDDDVHVNIKSTAVFFAQNVGIFVGILQFSVLAILLSVGIFANLNYLFYLGIGASAVNLGYQSYLLRSQCKNRIFQAFLMNNQFGFLVFLGIFLAYMYR